MNNSGTPILAQ